MLPARLQKEPQDPIEYSIWNILLGIYAKSNGKMPRPTSYKPHLTAIGARVRELRGEILQEELAAALGISQGQLSKIERGRMPPTLEVLLGLADRFGASIDWIARGEHFSPKKR
jgi:DNA-binding XRE family transcriptional regulator